MIGFLNLRFELNGVTLAGDEWLLAASGVEVDLREAVAAVLSHASFSPISDETGEHKPLFRFPI